MQSPHQKHSPIYSLGEWRYFSIKLICDYLASVTVNEERKMYFAKSYSTPSVNRRRPIDRPLNAPDQQDYERPATSSGVSDSVIKTSNTRQSVKRTRASQEWRSIGSSLSTLEIRSGACGQSATIARAVCSRLRPFNERIARLMNCSSCSGVIMGEAELGFWFFRESS